MVIPQFNSKPPAKCLPDSQRSSEEFVDVAMSDRTHLCPHHRNNVGARRVVFTLMLVVLVTFVGGLFFIYGHHGAFSHSRGPSMSVARSQPKVYQDTCAAEVADDEKFDCNPEEPTTEEICLARGCCWNNSVADMKGQNHNPLGVPYCYFPANYEGYRVESIDEEFQKTVITLSRNRMSGFTDDINTVRVEVTSLDEQTLRIKMYDPMSRRFEVPLPVLNLPPVKELTTKLYTIKVENEILTVSRQSTGTVIFNTDLRRLVFADQFLELSSRLPSKYIYGLGEHYDGLR